MSVVEHFLSEAVKYLALATIIFIAGGVWRDVRRTLRQFNDHIQTSRIESVRNCVHHGILFEHAGIPRSKVAEAEQQAGIQGPKGMAG